MFRLLEDYYYYFQSYCFIIIILLFNLLFLFFKLTLNNIIELDGHFEVIVIQSYFVFKLKFLYLKNYSANMLKFPQVTAKTQYFSSNLYNKLLLAFSSNTIISIVNSDLFNNWIKNNA